jgi:hypothetical protein
MRTIAEWHQGKVLIELKVRADLTKDIVLVFSQLMTVKLKKNDSYETVRGRWCTLCRSVLTDEWITEILTRILDGMKH